MRRSLLLSGAWMIPLATLIVAGPGRVEAQVADPALDGWKYPGAKVVSSGRGSSPTVSQSHAIMLTEDKFEKVVKYYEEMLGTAATVTGPGFVEKPVEPGEGRVSSGKARDDTGSVVQEDSAGRPVKLRVFVRNRESTSTSLVISRAEGEDQTHIAWSLFHRQR